MTSAPIHSPILPIAAIILAAGKGTRMRSDLPKVMHKIAARPMIGHVLSMAIDIGLDPISVVIAPEQTTVQNYARNLLPDVRIAYQNEQLGTAHAVRAAEAALKDFEGHLVVLYGDTPLIRSSTVQMLIDALSHDTKTAVAVLGFEPSDAAQYGRLILSDSGELLAIREYKDATEAERKVRLCNSGVMVLRGNIAWQLLAEIGNSNEKNEYYLTDIVEIALHAGYVARVVKADAEEVLGVNSRAELAIAEAYIQKRLRESAMEKGVTLIAPETVFFCADTDIGRDVIIEPHVVFGEQVAIADNVEIRSFSHIAGAVIESGSVIGPFARIRPGTTLGENSRVGNFVEIKKSTIEAGAKISHLSYIGDAFIGENTNIGAGTITCNYDGYNKFKTTIGAGAFIGSNSALVAPVIIGQGAMIAAGSVITENVSDNALALSRVQQSQKEDWAEIFRSKQISKK